MPQLEGMTPGQLQCWIEIAKYINAHGYSPSVDDLMEKMECRSRSTVQSRLSALQRYELISRKADVPRSTVVLQWPEEVPRRALS